jgi:hypothetical protein
VDPHTGETLDTAADHTQAGQGGDDGLLDLAHVSDVVSLRDTGGAGLYYQSIGVQWHQWISDQLARAVVGHIAAPVNPMDGNARFLSWPRRPKVKV